MNKDNQTRTYEEGFTAFMDGKKAADNPCMNHAHPDRANWWFAGWLDAQWEVVSKLKVTVTPRHVNLGAQGAEFSDGRALDVTPKGKN